MTNSLSSINKTTEEKYIGVQKYYHNPSRILQYFQSQTTTEVFQRTFAPPSVGSLAGVVGGAMLTNSVDGALFGGAVGLCSGLMLSAGVNYVKYKEFFNWLKANREKEVFKEFEKLHEDPPDLNEFIDPISMSLVLDPVRSPHGHVYDRSTLSTLSMLSADGTIQDPYRNASFTMADVVDAQDVFAKMKSVFKVLISKEINTVSNEVKEGLEQLVADLEMQIAEYIGNTIKDLHSDLRNGRISAFVFNRKVNELNKLMNPDVQEEV